MSLPGPYQPKAVHLTLKRGVKGYTWEVSVHDDDLLSAEQKTMAADQWMRAKFGGEGDEASPSSEGGSAAKLGSYHESTAASMALD